MGILDYSTTANSNTAISGTGIQGTSQVSNFDNALRTLMADVATALTTGLFTTLRYEALSANHTLDVNDRGRFLNCTATLELDLPAAATAGQGFAFIVSANGAAVTIDPNGTEEIDGSATSKVLASGTFAVVVCSGTAWFTIVGANPDISDVLRDSDLGVTVQEYDADTAKLDVEDQTVTGGARVTSKSLGTITTGTVTPDPGDRPLQHYTNDGAHTLAPGSNTGSYILDITNGASAGAITVSGWTKVEGAFTTTNAHKFRCSGTVGNAGSLLQIVALQ
jgi:hypothetical protein